MRMRQKQFRTAYALLFILLLFFLTYIFIKPIIVFQVKQQLGKIFIGSSIDIGGCGLNLLSSLSFKDIKIKREPQYDLRIRKAGIHYSLFSLLKGKILKVYAKEADVYLNLPNKSISSLNKYLSKYLAPSGKKPFFQVSDLELSEAKVSISTADLSLEAFVSLGLNAISQKINKVDLKLDYLESSGFKVQNASLSVGQGSPSGRFSISKINHDKFKIEKIESPARLLGKTLFLESASASIFKGRLSADIILDLEKNPHYQVSLNFADLNLDSLVRDLKLQEKVELSGKLGGRVILEGDGPDIKIIDGDLNTAEPGGVLTIKDNEYLENLARNSGESLDIIVESFKNYRYNTGTIKLSLKEGDLILDVYLNGEAGKRNLAVILHDFKLR